MMEHLKVKQETMASEGGAEAREGRERAAAGDRMSQRQLR